MTMESIAGKLVQKSGQVTFCCGQALYEIFQKYWPEFIFLHPDLMIGYISNLRQRVEVDASLERVALAHGLPISNAAFAARYVPPNFHQIKGKFFNAMDVPTIEEINQPMDRQGIKALSAKFDALFRVMQSLVLINESESDRFHRDLVVPKLEGIIRSLDEEWEKSERAFLAARRNHFKDGIPPAVPLSTKTIGQIIESAGYRCVLAAKQHIDILVAEANAMDFRGTDDVTVLGQGSYRDYTFALEALALAPRALGFVPKQAHFEIAHDLLERFNGHLLVTGAPGFGKTSFCRNNVLIDLSKMERSKTEVLPIYIPLHELSDADITSIESTVFRPEILLFIKKKPDTRIRLYLDGLDEIQSKVKQLALLSRVAQVLKSPHGDKLQCVITGRDHILTRDKTWLTRVRLSPLSDAQLKDLASKLLDHNQELVELFFARLAKLPGLVSVARVPLLGTLIILVFKHLKNLPENKNRLYGMFIDLLLGGWNLAKGIKRRTDFPSTTKLAVLTRLAGTMQASKQKECSAQRFLTTLREPAESLGGNAEPLLSEFVEDGVLIPTGRETYTFPHLSFQEYLAARDVADPIGAEASSCLTGFLEGDEWWREVAYFLIGMSSRPRKIEGWIVTHSERAKKAGRTDIPGIEARTRQLFDQLLLIFPDYELSIKKSDARDFHGWRS